MSKKVVLFGASGGIGSAIEKLLISTNYEVISITRSQINFTEPLIENKISKLLTELDPDIVINSAGWFGNNTDPFEEIMSVNFGSNWSIIRHYTSLPTIIKPVRIIMIGSICYNEGKKKYMVYAASKAALYSLWQGARDYFLDSLLCIDLINPQRTKTKMTILVYDFMKMWIFLIELIGYDRNEPENPEMLLAIGNAPGEASREALDEDLLHESESVSTDDEEDDFGFDEFDDDYSDDDLSDYNEYEY